MTPAMSLNSMIASLDSEDTIAVQKYVMFLLESKSKQPSRKKEALNNLSQFKAILNGEDRVALRDAALEELLKNTVSDLSTFEIE